MTLAKTRCVVKIRALMHSRLAHLLGALLLLSPLSLGSAGASARTGEVEAVPVQAAPPVMPAVEETPEDTFFASAGAGDSTSRKPPGWVLRQPGPETQVTRSIAERGVNPCFAPEPGFRAYSEWDRAPSVGQMILPKQLKLGPNGEFDVFFHFHGHEPARKAWVQAMDSVVLVGIDLGIGSGAYLRKFQTKEDFGQLLASVEAGVAERLSVPTAKARRIGVSSWSAGYGAVGQILRFGELRRRIDSVVLLDGLHSGYAGADLDAAKLAPFVDFAQMAARGRKLMFVSHSSIIPPDYASTTETANYLIWKTGGKPVKAHSRNGDPMGLSLVQRYSHGGFHVRGFAGNDTLDHCAHLGLFKDVLRTHVVPRWHLD